MRDAGQEVMYYPFILMDQMAGNGLPDPWSDAGSAGSALARADHHLRRAGPARQPGRHRRGGAEVDAFFGAAPRRRISAVVPVAPSAPEPRRRDVAP